MKKITIVQEDDGTYTVENEGAESSQMQAAEGQEGMPEAEPAGQAGQSFASLDEALAGVSDMLGSAGPDAAAQPAAEPMQTEPTEEESAGSGEDAMEQDMKAQYAKKKGMRPKEQASFEDYFSKPKV